MDALSEISVHELSPFISHETRNPEAPPEIAVLDIVDSFETSNTVDDGTYTLLLSEGLTEGGILPHEDIDEAIAPSQHLESNHETGAAESLLTEAYSEDGALAVEHAEVIEEPETSAEIEADSLESETLEAVMEDGVSTDEQMETADLSDETFEVKSEDNETETEIEVESGMPEIEVEFESEPPEIESAEEAEEIESLDIELEQVEELEVEEVELGTEEQLEAPSEDAIDTEGPDDQTGNQGFDVVGVDDEEEAQIAQEFNDSSDDSREFNEILSDDSQTGAPNSKINRDPNEWAPDLPSQDAIKNWAPDLPIVDIVVRETVTTFNIQQMVDPNLPLFQGKIEIPEKNKNLEVTFFSFSAPDPEELGYLQAV